MKKTYFVIFFLMVTESFAVAEPRPLPPIVDQSTYPGGNNQGSGHALSPKAIYETLGRLEQLQTEVQQLRGQVEEQDYTILELKKRIKNIYLDVDQRLLKLENGGIVATEQPNQAAVQTQAAPETQVVEQSKSPKKPNKSNKNEKQEYQSAFEKLVNGHTSQAIKRFNKFLADYPNGEYTANALYWLGEAYSIQQNLDLARKSFNLVINEHPYSPKVADAMLKLGYLEVKARNPVKAREWLTTVTTKYPGTTAAHLAAKRLKLLK